jgi:hypothetical protein
VVGLSAPCVAQNTAEPTNAAANLGEANSSPAAEETATANPVRLGEGTKDQAEHSAEATAHKSVNDPNNQLGTSLQGRTRPMAGSNNGPPYDTASAQTVPEQQQAVSQPQDADAQAPTILK